MFGRLGLLGNLGHTRSAGEVIDETVRVRARAAVSAAGKAALFATVSVGAVASVNAGLGAQVSISNIATVNANIRAAYVGAPALSNIASVAASGSAGYTGSVAVSNIAAVSIERNTATNDADAQAWIDAMSSAPNATYEAAYNSFVLNLKTGLTHSSDLWSALDEIWLHRGHDSQASLLGIKDPVNNVATAVNSPSHTAGSGFAGNGSSAYINYGGHPDSFGASYTSNDAAIAAEWVTLPVTASIFWLCGAGDGTGTGDATAQTYFGSNTVVADMHTSGGTTYGGSTSSGAAGLWCAARSSATQQNIYRDGVAIEVDNTRTTISVPNYDIYSLARNVAGSPSFYAPATVQIGCFALGRALTTNEQVDLKAALDQFATDVGA